MKFSTRLLLTSPLVIVTFFYLRFSLAENGCSGLMDLFFVGFFFIFFAVSILLAFRAAFRKRELYKNKTEPIILTIALITLSALIIGKVFGENFKGSKWIYATNKKNFTQQSLTLRNNETFRVDIGEADISSYFSGRFQKQNDTILLDKTVIEQTHSAFTLKYVLHDSLLIPVFDTTIESKGFDTLFIKQKD